jgi:DNA-binding SARP family transcriptional activator
VTRDELADLFWSARPRAAARSNLRKVLLLVQKIEGLPPLEQQGDRLRWMPDSDLQHFDAACAQRRHVDALALYRAPLLQGLDTGLPAGAEAWLSFERERVASRWREAATRRLAELSADPAAAAALAEELLKLDPFDEAALLALGQACGALEQPARGLQALQTHRKLLAAEYGLEPPATLRDLAERLRELRAVPVTRGDVHRPAAAAAAAIAMPGFVGRRIELGQLQQLLMQPACRVLTVTGPGGISKSTLARAALGTTPFDTSSWWVALDDLSDVTQLPGRIASVIGLDLQGGADPWHQIEAFIGQRRWLLVFDNSEHLTELAGFVATLLAACANLKLINTSRNRLSLDGEWLLPLDGLPLPDADETEPDVLRHNDAVRLFEARALAAAPAFVLGPAGRRRGSPAAYGRGIAVGDRTVRVVGATAANSRNRFRTRGGIARPAGRTRCERRSRQCRRRARPQPAGELCAFVADADALRTRQPGATGSSAGYSHRAPRQWRHAPVRSNWASWARRPSMRWATNSVRRCTSMIATTSPLRACPTLRALFSISTHRCVATSILAVSV